MIFLGHVGGIPVEETLTSFAPVGAVCIGAIVCTVRGRAALVRRLSRRMTRFLGRQSR
jgi:hypothetical protein